MSLCSSNRALVARVGTRVAGALLCLYSPEVEGSLIIITRERKHEH